MFKEIKGQFIDGLEEQHWMDDATREQARLKVCYTHRSVWGGEHKDLQ
jgi:hypothetical protein